MGIGVLTYLFLISGVSSTSFPIVAPIPGARGCGARHPFFRQQNRPCVRANAEGYELPPLPYAFDALEPYVDAQTMEIHHGKHHATYIANLNKILKDSPDIESIQAGAVKAGPGVRNNGGGHYNHATFWTNMAPADKAGTPSAEVEAAIVSAFGSMDAMKEKFTQAALTRFGSGWAWLGVKPDGTVGITSTANQDNPLMEGLEYPVEAMQPILGLDVWEHAYYLKYQNRRPEYVGAFWNVVNWNQVNKNYEDALKKAKQDSLQESSVSISIVPLIGLFVASGFALTAMHFTRRGLLTTREDLLLAK
jgi:Fe-Mn family superoxide dismutase